MHGLPLLNICLYWHVFSLSHVLTLIFSAVTVWPLIRWFFSSACGFTSIWTIPIRCSRKSATAARILGRMPLTHSCISHINVTKVPDRPTPALIYKAQMDCERWMSKKPLDGTAVHHAASMITLPEVRPAVHDSWTQTWNGVQMLPYVICKGTEWGWVSGDAPVRPRWIVVVCYNMICWPVSLKKNRKTQHPALMNIDSLRHNLCGRHAPQLTVGKTNCFSPVWG